MRGLTVVLMIFLFVGLADTQEKPGNKEVTLKVSGMMCGSCEKKVEKAAKAVEGVESVKATHAEGEVKIMLTGPTSLETLEAAINETGFKVVKEGKKEKRKKDGEKKSG